METIKSLDKKTSSCSVKRTYDVNTVITESAKHSVKVEYTVKQLILNRLNNLITDEDLKETVSHIYDDDDSVKGVAKRLRSDELYKCIMRYISSEKRVPALAEETVLDVFNTDVDINPDAMFITGDKLEIVKYFLKKPDIGARTESLGLYSLLYYAKQMAELVFPGKNIYVTASFYFLKKANDRKSELHPEKNCFDEDFFDRKGKNIVSLSDYNLGDVVDEASRVTELDGRYYTLFQNFKAGSKRMCDSNCKYCSMYRVCDFHLAKAPIPSSPKGSADVQYTLEQQKVIEFDKGIARVNAGAGTGKTSTIAGMVAKYLKNGIKPEEILVSTFTNASAKEMQERIADLCKKQNIDIDLSKAMINTFNSIGDVFMREQFNLCGFVSEPRLIEDSEENKIIEELLLENSVDGLDYTYLRMNEIYVKGGIVIAKDVIHVFKTYQIQRSELSDKLDFIKKKLSKDADFINDDIIINLYDVYEKYQKKLISESLCDYTDQELAFSRIDNKNPDYFIHTGIKKIVIDEFQDSNEAQLQIIKILMKSAVFESLVVVGDDSQSIYGFRDATPYNIINFDKIIGADITDFYLTRNFRSTPEVIDLANKINDLNTCRIRKTLISEKPHGAKVCVKAYKDNKHEYEDIANNIKALIAGGRSPEDIAFIARSQAELTNLQEYLDSNGIESTILVPELLKDNSRIQGVLGLYSFLTTEGDESGCVAYINTCLEGGWFDIKSTEREAYLKEYMGYAEIFREYDNDTKFNAFRELVDRIPGIVEDEIFANFIDSLNRYHTWGEICSYLFAFDVYGDKNSYSKKSKYSGVTLTTAHSSKGLEWPVVFNSITKYDKADLHDPNNLELLEEERRLLFVSVTRAKEELYISGKFYSFGTYTTAIDNKDPGTNINIFMKELYKIYNMGDIVSALKTANR